jgi:hypothetical protein
MPTLLALLQVPPISWRDFRNATASAIIFSAVFGSLFFFCASASRGPLIITTASANAPASQNRLIVFSILGFKGHFTGTSRSSVSSPQQKQRPGPA